MSDRFVRIPRRYRWSRWHHSSLDHQRVVNIRCLLTRLTDRRSGDLETTSNIVGSMWRTNRLTHHAADDQMIGQLSEIISSGLVRQLWQTSFHAMNWCEHVDVPIKCFTDHILIQLREERTRSGERHTPEETLTNNWSRWWWSNDDSLQSSEYSVSFVVNETKAAKADWGSWERDVQRRNRRRRTIDRMKTSSDRQCSRTIYGERMKEFQRSRWWSLPREGSMLAEFDQWHKETARRMIEGDLRAHYQSDSQKCTKTTTKWKA